MVSEAFKSFKHEQIFTSKGKDAIMIDKFYFESPFGIIGKIVNVLYLTKNIKNLLKTRNQYLKIKAENIQNQYS